MNERFDFEDLLDTGVELGYAWNEVHNFLIEANVYPTEPDNQIYIKLDYDNTSRIQNIINKFLTDRKRKGAILIR